MMNKKNGLILAATLLGTAALAHGNKHAMSWGSNSFSGEPRHASSPMAVVEPFTGFPESSMSTIDDRPGYLSKALTGNYRGGKLATGDIDVDNDVWAEDRTVNRSAAPRPLRADDHMAYGARHSHFTMYGDDLAALKGIQLDLALNHLHHLNQSQIGLAKMAESKAKTPSVLNLAHQIRADHERMEAKVEDLAAKRDVKLESFQLATYELVVKDRLESLAAPEFETAFLRVIDRNHDMAASDLRMIRDDVADEEVVTLVEEELPAIHAHKAASQIKARASTDEGDFGE